MIKIDRNSAVLVDFQYMLGNDRQIFVKELAFMQAGSVIPNFFHFKPPYHSKELDNGILTLQHTTKRNINGLDWSDGDIPYLSLSDILTPLNSFAVVIVRGEAKKQFLTKYLATNIVDLDLGQSLTSYPNYFTNCRIHKKLPVRCALNNLFKLFVFLESSNYEIYGK
ncbi:hypothetical protein [Drosophila-associated adintovirus 1]|uniref:Uncharacterized protein n=1 Tax=Drosophila-associated adintovirus 1 TaxID=2744816 RepID=A0A7D4VNY0_9VIRU|nr:hypothetical protein [Drosophila-associated adintovirus 1]